MKTIACWRWAACLLAFWATGTAMAQVAGFTVADAKNECFYYEQAERKAVTVGQQYPFGTTVETGRNSSLDLTLSEGNTFRLLARTKIAITQDTRDPRLKILRLETGSVDLQLDNMPKGEKLQVETPTAVCGAVGTRFAVTFESSDDKDLAGTRQSSFACDRGEVFVSSRFKVKEAVSTGRSMNVASVPAGSSFNATIHEGVENTFSDITVNRGKLTFQYGGEKGSTFVVAPEADDKPTRFVCAMEKSDAPVTLAAMEVKSGTVQSLKKGRFFAKDELTPVTAQDGAVIVHSQEVKTEQAPAGEPAAAAPSAAVEYLSAASTEGQLHSQLVDLEKNGAPQEQVQAKRVEAYAAAAKATELRNKMLVRNMVRLLNTVRRVQPKIPNVPKVPRRP
jgi:hypothetical protein